MASRYWVGGTGTWDASDTSHWAATSGGASGASVPGSGDTVTLDGSSGGGTITVAYDPTITSITMGAFTGTLDMNTRNPTMQTFNCSGTGTRTLTMGSGTWTITGNSATVFHIGTTTGLTFTPGNSIINCTYAGSAGTRVINSGEAAFALKNVKISAGTDRIETAGGGATSNFAGYLDFTGFSGTWDLNNSYNNNNFTGDLILSSTMTVNANAGGTKNINFTGTSVTQTLTTNGVILRANLVINGVSNVVVLNGNIDLTNTAESIITLTAGTFNTAGYSIIASSISSSNTNNRTLTLSSSLITLTGTGNVLQFGTMTNLVLNANTSNIYLSDVSASTKTIAHGSSLTLYDLTIAPTGSGAIIFGANPLTLHSLNLNGGSKTLQFTAGVGSTTTIAPGGWNVNGTSGNLVSITSGTPGSQAYLSVASGVVTGRYLSIIDSNAAGGASFQAINSTDAGNNTGWVFSTELTRYTNRVGQKFATFGGTRPYKKALYGDLHLYRKLGG